MHWLDLNRSEGLRVANVLVHDVKDRPELERVRDALVSNAPAPSTPARYRDALDGTTAIDPDPLLERLKRIAKEDCPNAGVTVMPLADRDGLIMDRRSSPGVYVQSIVAALGKLHRRGDVSEVVETPYGLHVLVLLETVPGQSASKSERDKLCPP